MDKLNFSYEKMVNEFDGVFVVVRDGLGKELFASKNIPDTCINADSLESESGILFDKNTGSYYSAKEKSMEDGNVQVTYIDITEHVKAIKNVRDKFNIQKELYESMKQTIESLKLDSTTGLTIRSQTMSDINDYIRYANEEGEPFAVMMLDIDHFKVVNDTYGHVVGDKVLKRVADVLRSSIRYSTGKRKKDIIGRYGGEEFVILLKNIPKEYVCNVAERIRASVGANPFRIQTGKNENASIPVTVSCGAFYPEDNETTIDEAIERADNALYVSKGNGRNCTTISETSHNKMKKMKREENYDR